MLGRESVRGPVYPRTRGIDEGVRLHHRDSIMAKVTTTMNSAHSPRSPSRPHRRRLGDPMASVPTHHPTPAAHAYAPPTSPIARIASHLHPTYPPSEPQPQPHPLKSSHPSSLHPPHQRSNLKRQPCSSCCDTSATQSHRHTTGVGSDKSSPVSVIGSSRRVSRRLKKPRRGRIEVRQSWHR